MKFKMLGLAGLAMGFMALAVSSASATTLEVGGVTNNSSVSLVGHLEEGDAIIFARTDLSLANLCEVSTIEGATSSPFTGTKVTGAVTKLTHESCALTVHVHKPGQFYIEHISGTTNGTVFSENTEVTVTTLFGFTVNCKTNTGVDIGKMYGVSSGNATLEIDAALNCGFLLPSAIWVGSYDVTSALGVSA